MKRHKTLAERFWPKVDKTPGQGPEGTCWIWTGAVGGRDYKKPNGGYGKLSHEGDTIYAHRTAWCLTHGEFPTLPTLHRCDMSRCVNPDHLFLGSLAENNEDMTRKGRRWTKLSPDQARKIRERRKNGERGIDLASEYGVSAGLIAHINTSRNWKHIA